MRESIATKAERYVGESRLTITRVDPTIVVADVRGHGSIYQVCWTPDSNWTCSCPARRRCAHVHAVQLVTVRGGGS
jgi:hypothetical protein